jgi:hypothetical protein
MRVSVKKYFSPVGFLTATIVVVGGAFLLSSFTRLEFLSSLLICAGALLLNGLVIALLDD